jgi:hypothetical protein
MVAGGRASRSVVVIGCLAAVVLIGALAVAYLHRQPQPSAALPATTPTGSATADAQLRCGQEPCRTLATGSAAGDKVELLADGSGGNGRVRFTGSNVYTVFETTITHLGATLSTSSLACDNGAAPVCLVTGHREDGSLGELFVYRAQDWENTDSTYFASGGYIALYQLPGASAPQIVAVQDQCVPQDEAPNCTPTQTFAQVYSLNGDEIGCTRPIPVSRRSELPGWPSVAPPSRDLRSCP